MCLSCSEGLERMMMMVMMRMVMMGGIIDPTVCVSVRACVSVSVCACEKQRAQTAKLCPNEM